jgi:hypothetical protein
MRDSLACADKGDGIERFANGEDAAEPIGFQKHSLESSGSQKLHLYLRNSVAADYLAHGVARSR